eukprot:Hpha_TRINITY_DN16622_c2_g1::TRINITY_DN16622_c2_g1_i1::g.181944::m.181944
MGRVLLPRKPAVSSPRAAEAALAAEALAEGVEGSAGYEGVWRDTDEAPPTPPDLAPRPLVLRQPQGGEVGAVLTPDIALLFRKLEESESLSGLLSEGVKEQSVLIGNQRREIDELLEALAALRREGAEAAEAAEAAGRAVEVRSGPGGEGNELFSAKRNLLAVQHDAERERTRAEEAEQQCAGWDEEKAAMAHELEQMRRRAARLANGVDGLRDELEATRRLAALAETERRRSRDEMLQHLRADVEAAARERDRERAELQAALNSIPEMRRTIAVAREAASAPRPVDGEEVIQRRREALDRLRDEVAAKRSATAALERKARLAEALGPESSALQELERLSARVDGLMREIADEGT